MGEFKRTITSAEEYNEVLEHAEALGFEPTEFYWNGSWASQYIKEPESESWKSVEGIPAWPDYAEVLDTGQKYFTTELDGNLTKLEPVTSEDREDGYIEVTFKD